MNFLDLKPITIDNPDKKWWQFWKPDHILDPKRISGVIAYKSIYIHDSITGKHYLPNHIKVNEEIKELPATIRAGDKIHLIMDKNYLTEDREER